MKKKILVAEDEDDIRLFLKLILELADFEVILASDGESCIRKFEEEKPELVICDVKMPKLSGLGVYERLKDKTKFVIVSGIVNENEVPKELVSAKRFFLKPFDPKGFANRIEEVLKNG
ncbi:MAG: response regulator [bacterium]